MTIIPEEATAFGLIGPELSFALLSEFLLLLLLLLCWNESPARSAVDWGQAASAIYPHRTLFGAVSLCAAALGVGTFPAYAIEVLL
jgi:hypothetical protein